MKAKKRLAAQILKTSPKKIKIDSEAIEDVKKAITRSDLRGLIAIGKVTKSRANQHSRARARKIAVQKRKGRRKGQGSKKGSKYSIINRKRQWIEKIRTQRDFLKELRDKSLLAKKDYQLLYNLAKGGFFRNKRHIKLYMTEHNLVQKKEKIRKTGISDGQ